MAVFFNKLTRPFGRAINRPIAWAINEWFIDVGPGAGVDNLLLESGDDLLLEGAAVPGDVLLLE